MGIKHSIQDRLSFVDIFAVHMRKANYVLPCRRKQGASLHSIYMDLCAFMRMH